MSTEKGREPLVLIVDGQVAGAVKKGDIIKVTKSSYTVDFISKKQNNFFNNLLIKLNKWSK